jgi:hypothetical protein
VIDEYNIMIRPNELRLGNWTLDKKGNYFKIRSGAQIDQSLTLSPIPLTNTILESCGFAFHTYFKVWQNVKPRAMKAPEMELDGDFNVRDFGHRYIGKQLKSLHQFQNFFFELKGIELETEGIKSQKQKGNT